MAIFLIWKSKNYKDAFFFFFFNLELKLKRPRFEPRGPIATSVFCHVGELKTRRRSALDSDCQKCWYVNLKIKRTSSSAGEGCESVQAVFLRPGLVV